MDANPIQPLSCTDILFRALIYDSLVAKDGSHKVTAFIRRREADPNGLSVNTTIEECRAGLARGIYGVRSVHVGTLRDNGFDVLLDTPTHGNIGLLGGGLTPRRQDDELRANELAELLLSCTRPVLYFAEQDADERFIQELEVKRAAGNAQ